MFFIKKIRQEAISRLEQADIASPRLDVDLLLEQATGLTPLEIALEGMREISFGEVEVFQELIKRRAAREPVSQILGKKDFWTLTFKVSRHCLTPRPDSETLIEAALEVIADRKAPLKILDLGTGSGCLLLSLMSELPHSHGVGVDLSEEALALARENAENLDLAGRCVFLLSDWATTLPPDQRFDIILCNPPYIALGEKVGLERDVRDYEPPLALFAEKDGLQEYERLARIIPDLLTPGGYAFLEIGHKQGPAVRKIFQDSGVKQLEIIPDLAGRDRCVLLRV